MAIAIGGIALVAGLYGSSALSSPSSKFFAAARAPANVPAGQTVDITFTIQNCGPSVTPLPACSGYTSSQSLGSADVALNSGTPSGSLLNGFGISTQPSGYPITPSGWSATVNSSTNSFQLTSSGSSSSLAPGQQVSVTVKVRVPQTAGSYTLTSLIRAKQSNDFSGNGNDMTYKGSQLPITVDPGPFHHFGSSTDGAQPVTLSPASPETAGVPFTLTATAYDQYNNKITTYTGPASISSTPTLSSSSTGCSAAPSTSIPPGTLPCSPSYGSLSSWTNGTATATLKAFVKQTVTLKVTDTGSNLFSTTLLQVNPASPYSLTFVNQPTESLVNCFINTTGCSTSTPGNVSARVQDQFGNNVSGADVNMTLGPHIGTGSLSCVPGTCMATSVAGIATFDKLKISDVGEYSLIASSGSATKTSDGFIVATSLTPCSPGSCSSPSGLTTSASATGVASGFLGVAQTVNAAPIPTGVCNGFTPADPNNVINWIVNTVSSGGDTPTLTINVVIPKSIVNAGPNSGASHFDVCLGSVNLTSLMNNPPVTPWTQKDGTASTPVLDTVLNQVFFWGIVPDAPPGVHNCTDAATAGLGPVILSENKANGDVIITMCAPYPWDSRGYN